MRKTLIIFLLLVVGLVLSANPTASAQSPTLQEAFEGVEGQVEDLVVSRDESELDDLALRIATFKKVIEFSVSEAKDLKIKLLTLDQIKETASSWREERIDNLNQALAYYEEQKRLVEDNEITDLETVKGLASNFKDWREQTYLPTAGQVNEFLLIKQEQNAIEIAERRWQRIDKDITKLESINLKGVSTLRELLGAADELIKESNVINRDAEDLFFKRHIYKATSTEEGEGVLLTTSSQIFITIVDNPEGENESVSAPEKQKDTTSTEVGVTSTEPLLSPLSIKDLVKDSLTKVREAYQVFIEMSNLVRKLLN